MRFGFYRRGVAIVAIATACRLVTTNVATAADADEHVAAIATRQQLVDRVEALYTVKEVHSRVRDNGPPVDELLPGIRSVPNEGKRTYRAMFRYAGQRAWYEQLNVIASELESDRILPEHHVAAYSSARFEALLGHEGFIRNTESPPKDKTIDLALGLSMVNPRQWMSEEDWRACSARQSDDGLVELSLEKSFVDVPWLGLRHTWTFLPDQEYVLSRYFVQLLDDSPRNEGPQYEVINGDFKAVSGLLLPMTVSLRQFFLPKDGKSPVVILAQDVTVEQYTLGKVRDSDEDFLIRWPAGAMVSDNRTGKIHHIETEGLQLTEDYLASLRRGAVAAAGSAGNGVSPRSRLWMLLWANVFLVTVALVYTAWRMRWKRP